jgi:RNA ligase
MSLTKEILNDYIARGLVVETRHPNLPLGIYNYSRGCQYAGDWDEVTLACRGLIMDDHGVIVASGFKKFFNYEEALRMGTVPTRFDHCYLQDKMDGSLGILFHYSGEWHMATKGSFVSDQALKGMEILKRKYDLSTFMPEFTYLVEIIYPENRIVVKYSDERLVFIGLCRGGEELNWATASTIFAASKIDMLDIVNTRWTHDAGPALYEELKARNTENAEGFVLRFYPGNFRMKIKFNEYVRLHRLLTEFSNILGIILSSPTGATNGVGENIIAVSLVFFRNSFVVLNILDP